MTGRKKSVSRQKSGGRQKPTAKKSGTKQTRSRTNVEIQRDLSIELCDAEISEDRVGADRIRDTKKQQYDIPLHIDYDQVRKTLRDMKVDPQSMEIYELLDRIDKGKGEYLLGQKEYSADPRVKAFAKADVDAYWIWFGSGRNDALRHKIMNVQEDMRRLLETGAHPNRDRDYFKKEFELKKLWAEAASRYVDTREPHWDERRLVWFCEELTDQNYHAESGYLSGVHLGKIPADIYWDAEKKKQGARYSFE